MACQVNYAASLNASCSWATKDQIYVDANTFTYYFYSGSGSCSNYNGTITVLRSFACPPSSTYDAATNTCTCSAGTTEGPPANGYAGSCVAGNNCPAAGTSAGNWTLPGGTGPKQVCDTDTPSGDSAQPGCYASGTADFAVGVPPNQSSTAPMIYSGAKCAPSPTGSYDGTSGTAPAPNSSTAPTPCPPGKVSGTVNGTTVCVDPGTSTPTQQAGKTSNTTTNPDGTTSTQDTTTTTSCDATGCTKTTTTTTTTKDSSGNVTGTSTVSNNGTCTRGSPGCSPDGSDKETSSFGGTCAAFSCDGDAIMCAVALEQHQRNCALFETSSEESQLYTQEKGKTGAQYQNENVSASTAITASNLLGASGSCQLDRTVTVWGHEVVLPFSQVCTALSYMGTLLVMVSFLLAYRIVARG